MYHDILVKIVSYLTFMAVQWLYFYKFKKKIKNIDFLSYAEWKLMASTFYA